MKVLLVALAVLVLANVGALAWSASRPGPPRIVHQISTMVFHNDASPTWERHIKIQNPRDRAVWVYIECESRLTTNPIGLPGRRTVTVTLPDIPPAEGCVLNHWREQRSGESPEPWSP